MRGRYRPTEERLPRQAHRSLIRSACWRRHCLGARGCPLGLGAGLCGAALPMECGDARRLLAGTRLRLSCHHPARPCPDLELAWGSPGPCSVRVGSGRPGPRGCLHTISIQPVSGHSWKGSGDGHASELCHSSDVSAVKPVCVSHPEWHNFLPGSKTRCPRESQKEGHTLPVRDRRGWACSRGSEGWGHGDSRLVKWGRAPLGVSQEAQSGTRVG